MERKCFICGSVMQEKTIQAEVGWGKKNFGTTKATAFVCTGCGWIAYSSKEVHRLQELGKKIFNREE